MSSSKADFLARVPLFKQMYDDELLQLAEIAEERFYPKDRVIAYQRDVADSMFVVKTGRLVSLSISDDGAEESRTRHMPGDVVGDERLFSLAPQPATIKAAADSNLLVFSSKAFLTWLGTDQDALNRLQFSEDARDAAAHSMFTRPRRGYGSVTLTPDEIVKYQSRRSPLLLFLRLTLPVLGVLLVPFAVFLLLQQFGMTEFFGIWSYVLALLPSLFLFLYCCFVLLDWSNDWFVVTNKHLIHYELDLRRFSSTITKVPVDQIQSVEIEKSNIWANLFNVGIARITTAARETAIIFDFIDNPDAVRDTISSMQQISRALDAGREQASMRSSIEGHFRARRPYTVVEEAEPADDTEVIFEESQFSFLESLGAIWSAIRLNFRSRVEEGEVITYRKHFIVLLDQIKWPIGLLALLAIIALILIRFQFGLGTLLWLVLPLFGLLGFLVWKVEDWRNDTYQLTDQYVVDIDRRPFGFGESRKQAELGNVQNVSADRPNFLATIFNFGIVEIETAGATAQIVFENVANPTQIQSDVFSRREAYKRKQSRAQRNASRKEYAVLLDVYHQANEQGRIPRRTPTEELLFDEYGEPEEAFDPFADDPFDDEVDVA